MPNTIHCDNCGANMNVDTDKMMQFCPYCGAAFPKKDDILECSKFKLKHDEEVRQRQVAEKREDQKKNDKQLWIVILVAALLLAGIVFGLSQMDQNRKAEEASKKVQQLIREEKYDEALLEAQNIRVDNSETYKDSYKRWEIERNDLIKFIEQKQKEAK